MVTYLPTPRYAVSGIRRVLVANWSASTRFRFATATTDVIDLLSPAPTWYGLLATDGAQAAQASTREKTGLRHAQKLTLPFVTGFSRAQREALLALFQQPVYVLFEDGQGSWWLAGQRRGLRCTNLQLSTGPAGGETTATVTLEGAEPDAWRLFDSSTALALYAAAAAATVEAPGDGDGLEL